MSHGARKDVNDQLITNCILRLAIWVDLSPYQDQNRKARRLKKKIMIFVQNVIYIIQHCLFYIVVLSISSYFYFLCHLTYTMTIYLYYFLIPLMIMLKYRWWKRGFGANFYSLISNICQLDFFQNPTLQFHSPGKLRDLGELD